MPKNVSYTGSFIGMLASLASRALPTILTGLTTGLLSGGISKAVSGGGTAAGEGLFLQHGKSYRVQKCKSDGLYLAPYQRLVEGYRLFLKHGNDSSDGARLLIGAKSPFKNILRWLL